MHRVHLYMQRYLSGLLLSELIHCEFDIAFNYVKFNSWVI